MAYYVPLIGEDTPTTVGVLGQLWYKPTTDQWAECTNISPVTFTNLSGSSPAVYAPIVVAASDATAKEKATATASGGSICDGTNDETEIQAANDTAAGMCVLLLGHTFNIQTADLTINNCILTGQGFTGADNQPWPNQLTLVHTLGTMLSVSNGRKIIVDRGGSMRSLLVHTGTGYVGTAIQVGGTGMVGWASKMLDDIYVYGDSYVGGTGIYVYHVCETHFGKLQIRGYKNQLHLYATTGGFVNGNIFDAVIGYGGENFITLQNDTNGQGATGNIFSAVQYQPCAMGMTNGNAPAAGKVLIDTSGDHRLTNAQVGANIYITSGTHTTPGWYTVASADSVDQVTLNATYISDAGHSDIVWKMYLSMKGIQIIGNNSINASANHFAAAMEFDNGSLGGNWIEANTYTYHNIIKGYWEGTQADTGTANNMTSY